MSNSSNKLSSTNRAMLIGALVGGGAAVASEWKALKQGEVDTQELVGKASKAAIQAAAISGATTYVAEKMAGRPALSLLTLLSAGTAGLYLIEQISENKDE